jgi:hypothetical protein
MVTPKRFYGIAPAGWSPMPPGIPRHFYGDWPELERIELGDRAAYAYDESSTLEHRLCRAIGLTYGCPPRHWKWTKGPF